MKRELFSNQDKWSTARKTDGLNTNKLSVERLNQMQTQADIHNYTWMLVNRSSSRDNDLGGIKSNHKWDTSQKDKLKT